MRAVYITVIAKNYKDLSNHKLVNCFAIKTNPIHRISETFLSICLKNQNNFMGMCMFHILPVISENVSVCIQRVLLKIILIKSVKGEVT